MKVGMLPPVFDVVLLRSGRILLALGERGTRLVTLTGKTVAHFDVPSHHLVIADTGERAIALARREGCYQLARLDLEGLTAETWCQADLHCWSMHHEGPFWAVVVGDVALGVDTLHGDRSCLATAGARISARGRILDVALSGRNCDVLLETRDKARKLSSERHDMVGGSFMSARELTLFPDSLTAHRVVACNPMWAVGVCEQASTHTAMEQAYALGMSNRHGTKRFRLTIPARPFGPGAEFVPLPETALDDGPLRPHMNCGMASFSIRTSLGVAVVVLNLAHMEVIMRVYLPQARKATLRLRAPQDLCVADDLGRVAVIDCARRIPRNTFEVT